jgi:hypothetical protein
MNAMAEKFAQFDVGSYFLYTHEAHPGEIYPHITSMEQKFRHAEALRDIYGVSRPIIIDTVDGACHRAYGSMPNMSWIFNRTGVPIYKSNWTDANSLDSALEYFLDVDQRRNSGERLGPFHVERMDYRVVDRESFYAGLARNGPKAVREFRDAFG